jgi:hypothetical protein
MPSSIVGTMVAHEPDSSPMVQSLAEQYRAQATRYHALADQAVDPARAALYRRLERGYLTLADLAARPRSGASPSGSQAHDNHKPPSGATAPRRLRRGRGQDHFRLSA